MKRFSKFILVGASVLSLNLTTVKKSEAMVYAWPAFVAMTPASAAAGGVMFWMGVGGVVVGGVFKGLDGSSSGHSSRYTTNNGILGYLGTFLTVVGDLACCGSLIALNSTQGDNGLPDLPLVSQDQINQYLQLDYVKELKLTEKDFNDFNNYRNHISSVMQKVYNKSLDLQSCEYSSEEAIKMSVDHFKFQIDFLPQNVRNAMAAIGYDIMTN